MSAGELQACLARLYTDDSFRALFYRDPKPTLDGYFLEPAERDALVQIDHGMLELFAGTLKTKRRAKLQRAYAGIFALSHPRVETYWLRYDQLFPLRPNTKPGDEIGAFGYFLEETLRTDHVLPPYAADLVRFERIFQTLRLQVRAAAPRREATPWSPGPGDRCRRKPDVAVERFSHNVSEIDEALSRGEDPAHVARQVEEYVVCALREGEREPRVLRVSAPISRLLELCDGTRSVEKIVSELEGHYGQNGLGPSIIASIAELAALEILEVDQEVGDGDRPSVLDQGDGDPARSEAAHRV